MIPSISTAVRRFLAERFLYRDDASLPPDASLLEAGLMDSVNVLELILFLESEFGIQVADEEIVPDNLDSLRAISRYVGRKLAARNRGRLAGRVR